MIRKISVRRFCVTMGVICFLLSIVVVSIIYKLTEETAVWLCGGGLSCLFLCYYILLIEFMNQKLADFTLQLCDMLDQMINGKYIEINGCDEETLLSRIRHRLKKLYYVMQDKQNEVDKEKTDLQVMISDISHQTKTAITNLKMLNDTLLNKKNSDEKRIEFLNAMAGQLNKLEFLIQFMVKMSRLETGVITLKSSVSPILETIAAAANGVLALIEEKELELNVECPEDLLVNHDCRWTSEAIYNLLDNAVKYTAPGGKIDILVNEYEMHIVICVKDTGRGIPECEQAAIFQRFYREAAVHEISGIGIGLYLTRQIVSMQGGYAKVESKVGKGSAFSIYLPKN